jgi:hypothetical protein
MLEGKGDLNRKEKGKSRSTTAMGRGEMDVRTGEPQCGSDIGAP